MAAERRGINPWTWQDQFGYVQANEVSGAQRTIFCAGQTSVDEEGRSVHPEDMRAQITLAMDNLETGQKRGKDQHEGTDRGPVHHARRLRLRRRCASLLVK